MTERHVQAIWFDSRLRPEGLVTDRGEPVKVIDPGMWNLEAGPDFKDAVLEIGEEACARVVAGDVEVHIVPGDWTSHGHASNPAYGNVMLHVVWERGARPADLPREVETVSLKDAFGEGRLCAVDVDAYPYQVPPPNAGECGERLAELDLEAKQRLLAAAGLRRLNAKAVKFARMLAAGMDAVEILYGALMEAMGWKANTANFRELARLLPYCEMPRDPGAALAKLHGAAILVKWNRAATRPNNQPEARFGAIARMCSDLPGLLERLAACDWTCRKGVSRAVGILCGDGVELPFPARLGKQRASAVAANIVWPLLRATGRAGVATWLPPEDESSVVRETAHRLFGRDSSTAAYSGNGLWIQGLIGISKEFCARFRPSCDGCPLAAAREAEKCA